MSSVRGAKCYPNVTRLYAPTCNDGCMEAVYALITEVNDIFKGSTVYDASGSWIGRRGRAVGEPVKVIEAWGNCLDEERAGRLTQAIVKYGVTANQREVSVIAGNQFFMGEKKRMVELWESRRGQLHSRLSVCDRLHRRCRVSQSRKGVA